MSSVGLVVAGVSHAYQSLAVLDGLDLDIPAGEVTVLVGPSGCGKSTLLGILGGLVAPSSGVVRMRGAVDAACLNPLTYVFQDFSLVPWRSVAGNVSLVLEDSRLSRAERTARVSEVLASDRAVRICVLPGRSSSPGECASAWESHGRWRCGQRCC